MHRFASAFLAVFAIVASASAQVSFNVKTGRGKWGYADPYAALVQKWNGSAFTLETRVHFPKAGKPGCLPRESFFGFFVKDTKRGHRYCPGFFNPGWDANPDPLLLGVTRHEAYGNWSPIVFKGRGVPKKVGIARLRLVFKPAEKGAKHSLLVFSYAPDGRPWVEAWRYDAPANLAPNLIGLTADSYHGYSFGPVVFDYFRVTGKGPAVSDAFDGAGSATVWRKQQEERAEMSLPVKLDGTFILDKNAFVFDRGCPAAVSLLLHTTMLVGQTVSIEGVVSDYQGHPVHSENKSVRFANEKVKVTFPLSPKALEQNGIYRFRVRVSLGKELITSFTLQFAVIEPRPMPKDFDPSSPYSYNSIENYAVARRMGIRWSRASWFSWDVPRRADGAFDFTKLDKAFAASTPNKILQLGPICGPTIADFRPKSIGKYVETHVAEIEQARKRYGDALQLIEIGNEPENWPVAPLEQEWLTMAKAQAEITRRVHERVPGVKVMSTGTTHVNLAFLGQLAAIGGPNAADVIGVHGYRSPSPPEFGHEDDIRAIRELFPDKPIWCNEEAYFSHPPEYHPTFDTPKISLLEVDELTQGVYLPRLWLSQLAAGYAGVNWFSWDSNHGLFHGATHVRPGVCTLAALTRLLPHPTFLKRLTPMNCELWALQFESDGRTVTALWSLGPRWRVKVAAAEVQAVRDVFGNPVEPRRAGNVVVLTVGQAPYYLTGKVSKLIELKIDPDAPAPFPLLPAERPPSAAVTVHILPRVSGMHASGIRVRVTNRTTKDVRGEVLAKFNEAVSEYHDPVPKSWRLAPVETDRFKLTPKQVVNVDFRIVSDDPRQPFDPYHPGPGFVALWWATGYFFAARAKLDDGRTFDCVPNRGFCLRGAPLLENVTVDGKLGEWDSVPVFPDMGKQTRNVGLYQFWFGEADYRPEFKFAWCRDGLLFAATVEDDIHHQIAVGPRTWQYDSIDLAIDGRPDDPSVVDFHLFTLALTPKGPQGYRRRDTRHKKQGLVTSAKLKIRRIDPDYGRNGSTIYELLLPWSELDPLKPAPGKRLGFAVQFNESDGWGRMGWEGWFIPMGGQIVSPCRFGDLTLVK